jgi:nucleoside-diphosphate-sugar epimerase
VTKARTLLGWKSKHDLRSTIYHTMEYFVGEFRKKQKAAK